MEREAIELHDSVIASAEPAGADLKLTLTPVYVHRSSGKPATDGGTGWLACAHLTVFGAAAPGRISVPARIWDGTLHVGDAQFVNVIPLPFIGSGAVSLFLELSSGERLGITGNGVELSVVGPYTFVERVPAA